MANVDLVVSWKRIESKIHPVDTPFAINSDGFVQVCTDAPAPGIGRRAFGDRDAFDREFMIVL